MNRWILPALVLSLALNLGFGLAWFGHQRTFPPPYGGRALRHVDGGDPGHHPRRSPEGEWAQRRARRLHRELGLDAERRDRLHALLEPLQPEIARTRNELLDARRGFADALHVESPDRQEVMRLRGEVSRRQAALDSLVAEALLRESQVLDLEERRRSDPWFHHPELGPLHKEMRR